MGQMQSSQPFMIYLVPYSQIIPEWRLASSGQQL